MAATDERERTYDDELEDGTPGDDPYDAEENNEYYEDVEEEEEDDDDEEEAEEEEDDGLMESERRAFAEMEKNLPEPQQPVATVEEPFLDSLDG